MVSAQTVSKLTRDLDEAQRQFHQARLDDGYAYLFLKGVSLRVASDALVLPSDGGETWGLVVNEAMACARPCIVSDRVGCGPDLVIPQETGSIFPLGDVEALANSMLELAGNPERMISMGLEARSRLRNYSVETAVDGIIESLAATLEPRVLHASA